jgi:indole-3-glycerol phosphate synthase
MHAKRSAGVILDQIIAAKHAEIATSKASRSLDVLRRLPQYGETRRGFLHAIRSARSRCVIAEIKRKSPSRGVIRPDFEPVRHALDYERGGATCLSVLTDQQFFGGSLEHLAAVRAACRLPLLRKDFLVDSYQVVESRAFGADAVLLILAALDPATFDSLLEVARRESLDVLVEVHDERELGVALQRGADLIGINNRDLRTFVTTIDTTRRLMPSVPAAVTVIAESGLTERDQLTELEACGVRGFLIGEALMSAPEPGRALAGLLRP